MALSMERGRRVTERTLIGDTPLAVAAEVARFPVTQAIWVVMGLVDSGVLRWCGAEDRLRLLPMTSDGDLVH